VRGEICSNNSFEKRSSSQGKKWSGKSQCKGGSLFIEKKGPHTGRMLVKKGRRKKGWFSLRQKRNQRGEVCKGGGKRLLTVCIRRGSTCVHQGPKKEVSLSVQ